MRGLISLFSTIIVVFSCIICSNAEAQSTRYSLNAPPFSSIDNSAATPCDIPPCPTYQNGQKITGYFTLANPLPGGLDTFEVQASSVTDFSFSDGVQTYTPSDPNVRLSQIEVSTDSNGAITDFQIWVSRWNQLPHGTLDTANGRVGYFYVSSYVDYTGVGQISEQNQPCRGVDRSSAGVPDTCTVYRVYPNNASQGSDETTAKGDRGTVTRSAVVAAPVPTLSEWALIAIAAAMAWAGAMCIQPRSSRLIQF